LTNYRDKYIKDYGLIIPEGCGHHTLRHCCKAESPEIHEIMLMSRPHQWAKMARLQKETFDMFMKVVSKYEARLFRALNLPPVNDIRITFIKRYSQKTLDRMYTKQYDVTQAELQEMDGVLADWADESNEVYRNQMLAAFAASLLRVHVGVLEQYPKELRDLVIARAVEPSLDNVFLKSIVDNGVTRISEKLTIEYANIAREVIAQGVRDGRPMIDIARILHRKVGEGQAWQWLRLARSELVLGYNGAFLAECASQGVLYYEWVAAPDACPICSPLDGRVWEVGKGPLPVQDTHPNCNCFPLERFEVNRVQNPWARPSPYDVSYSKEEIENLTAFLNSEV